MASPGATQLLVLSAALVPVAGLVLLARKVGYQGPRLLDADAARDRAHAELPGFAAQEVLVSPDRTAALVRDAAGHVVLVYSIGAHLACRKLTEAAARGATVSAKGAPGSSSTLVFHTEDIGRNRFSVRLEPDDLARFRAWQNPD